MRTGQATRLYNTLSYRNLMENPPRWSGVPVIKFPNDLLLYAQVIHEKQPDFIVETGTSYGGSSAFFADMLNLTGKGLAVVTIDIDDQRRIYHPNVTFLHGSSIERKIIDQVKDIVGSGSVMVSLDSNHSWRHVRRELFFYSKIVTKGQYLTVEDLCDRNGNIRKGRGPAPAVERFLMKNRRYKRVPLHDQFLVTVTKHGWLLHG